MNLTEQLVTTLAELIQTPRIKLMASEALAQDLPDQPEVDAKGKLSGDLLPNEPLDLLALYTKLEYMERTAGAKRVGEIGEIKQELPSLS